MVCNVKKAVKTQRGSKSLFFGKYSETCTDLNFCSCYYFHNFPDFSRNFY